jgi:hypothetical protein
VAFKRDTAALTEHVADLPNWYLPSSEQTDSLFQDTDKSLLTCAYAKLTARDVAWVGDYDKGN